MKKLYLYLLLTISSIAYTQNTGINTDNPQQTLDIQGTLGISQPGEANQNIDSYSPSDANLLYWNPNNKKIVTIDQQNLRPFKRVQYRLALKDPVKAEIKDLDLNINADKYTVFIMGYRLLVYQKQFGETDEIRQDVVYIPAIQFPTDDIARRTPGTAYTSGNYQRIITNGGNANKGYIVREDNNAWAYSKLAITTPKVYLKKDGNKWKINANYHKLSPKSFNYNYFWFEHKQLSKTEPGLNNNRRYVWRVDLLIVDNNFITDLGEIKATAKKPTGQDSRFETAEMQKVKQGLGVIAAP